MESYRENLPQTGDLGAYKPSRPRADMAIDTGYARVRRILIGGIFRSHHGVTRCPAEACGIHVLDAAIRRRADDQEVDDGREGHPFQGTPHHGEVQVDGGENSR